MLDFQCSMVDQVVARTCYIVIALLVLKRMQKSCVSDVLMTDTWAIFTEHPLYIGMLNAQAKIHQ